MNNDYIKFFMFHCLHDLFVDANEKIFNTEIVLKINGNPMYFKSVSIPVVTRPIYTMYYFIAKTNKNETLRIYYTNIDCASLENLLRAYYNHLTIEMEAKGKKPLNKYNSYTEFILEKTRNYKSILNKAFQ